MASEVTRPGIMVGTHTGQDFGTPLGGAAVNTLVSQESPQM